MEATSPQFRRGVGISLHPWQVHRSEIWAEGLWSEMNSNWCESLQLWQMDMLFCHMILGYIYVVVFTVDICMLGERFACGFTSKHWPSLDLLLMVGRYLERREGGCLPK